jgi:hypothetical protein
MKLTLALSTAGAVFSTAAITTTNAFGLTHPQARSAFVPNSAQSATSRQSSATTTTTTTSLSMTLSQEQHTNQRELGGTANCPEIRLTPLLSSTNEVAVFALG